MTMSGMNPLPPHVVHSSTQLTHARAHSLLNEFLQNTEIDASYRPDSVLTDHGPQSASTGASPNLTLHHLKRILQGIEGKRVGGENVNTLFGELSSANKRTNKKRVAETHSSSSPTVKVNPPDNKRRKLQTATETAEQEGIVEEVTREDDDWVDKDDYEHAQREDEVEIAQEDAHPAGVDQPGNEDEVQEEMEVHVEKKVLSPAEKKARKRAKHDRKEKEKRTRESARAHKSKR